MKLPNFDNCSNGKLSKIGYHFRKYNDFKIDVIKKMAITKNVLSNFYSLMKKNLKDSEEF